MAALQAEDWRALSMSALAGGATAIGGVLAVVHRPEAALLAFLLGTAIGVMATLSVIELLIQNAREHGLVPVRPCASETLLLLPHAFGAGEPLFRPRRRLLRLRGAVDAARPG